VAQDYGCKVQVAESVLNKVRKIKTPDDIRPGTRKGKIDKEEIILIKIAMPKKLMSDIQRGYESLDANKVEDILTQNHITATAPMDAAAQPAEQEGANAEQTA